MQTPRKSGADCKTYSQAPGEDEPHRTPFWAPPVAIPTEQCTPEVNWGEFARHLQDNSQEQDTPTPFPCGGPQSCVTWTHTISPSSDNLNMMLPCRNQNFHPSTLIPPEAAAALGAVVPGGAVWDDLMSSAREHEESWQLWLSKPPPCPTPMRISQLLNSSSEGFGAFPAHQQEAPIPSTPRKGGTIRHSTPPTPGRRCPVPRTPARTSAVFEDSECPSTPRKKPRTPTWMSPPTPMTPAIGFNRGQPQAEATPPCTPRKRSSAFDSPPPTPLSTSYELRTCWPPSPPEGWGAFVPGEVSPVKFGGAAVKFGEPICEDDENRDPNVGRFTREFCKAVSIKEGRCTKVFRARHKMDRQVYAIKAQVVANDMQQQVLLREVAILSSFEQEGLGGLNILRYFSAWKEEDLLHVQTEPYECSLKDHFRNYSGLAQLREQRCIHEEIVSLLRDAATGLATLHSQGVAHTDVRPENIVRTEQGTFKIAGLGRCQRLSGEEMQLNLLRDTTLNRDYLAPERMRSGGDPSQLPLADVFSLALVVCEFAACPAALSSEAWQQLRIDSVSMLRPLRNKEHHIVRQMLQPIPGDRPVCAEIAQRAAAIKEVAEDTAVAHNTAEVQTSRASRIAELRNAIRQEEKAAEENKQRAEETKRELEALKHRRQTREAPTSKQ